MADQIVIELIGDPSGLKPAEDALKELSKISQENMEAFNKANESMKKFQEALSEASKKAGEATESTKKLGEAMKGIGERADSVSKAAKAIDDLGTSATKSITAISGLNGVIAANAIKDVVKDTKDWGAKIVELTEKQAGLKTQIADNSERMINQEAIGGKTSTQYLELAANNTKFGQSLGGTTTALNKAIEAYKNQGKAATEARDAAQKSEEKQDASTKKTEEGGKAAGGLTSKLKALGGAHKDTAKNTSDLLGHTQTLTTALGEVGAAMAHAAGNEDAAAEIKKKTAFAIQAICTAQSVATAATEAGTVATTIFGTAAAAAWASATLGLSVLVAGIVALVANFDKVTHFFKKLWDPNTPKSYNEQLEETVKKTQDLSDAAAKQVVTLEAQGKSALEINAAKQEQVKTDGELLEAQKQLAIANHDTAKAKELQNKYDEEGLSLTRLKTEATNIQKAADKEASDKKKQDSDDAKAAYDKQLSDVKALADARLSITKADSKEELDARISDLNAAAAIELNNAKGNAQMKAAINDKLKQDIAAAQDAFRTRELQAQRADLEAGLKLDTTNAEEKHKLKLGLLDIEHQLALSQENLTANQKLLIDQDYEKKVKALTTDTEHDKAQIETNARRTQIQISLLDTKTTSSQKLQLEKEALKIESDQRIAAIRASGRSQVEIDKEVALEETKLTADILAKDQAAAKASIDKTLQEELKAIDDKKKAKNLSHQESEALFLQGINTHRAAIEAMHKAGLTDDKQYQDQLKAHDDETARHKEENAKKTQELEKKAAKEAINLAKQVADAIFAAQAEKRQQALDETIKTLEAQKTAELSNHNLTAAQKAAVEKKYHDQEAAVKLKAWKADQKAKAEQAIINGLLAVTSALATVQPTLPDGIIAGALALASAGVAVGQILAKSPPKFAKGVISLDGPGTETSDSIAAYLSKGESVITAERTRQYKPVLEQIQAGIYQPLPIPLLSTFPRLNDLSAIGPPLERGQGGFDYEKLGRAVAQALPKNKVQKLSFDKKGFSHYLISESGKLESYNSRYRE